MNKKHWYHRLGAFALCAVIWAAGESSGANTAFIFGAFCAFALNSVMDLLNE